METNIYLIIIIIVIIVLVYVLLKRNILLEKNTNKIKTYDLVIYFKKDKYVDIRKINEFKEIASWNAYSKYGFRGFSKLSKEELELFVKENLHLESDDFDIVKGNPELYLPS